MSERQVHQHKEREADERRAQRTVMVGVVSLGAVAILEVLIAFWSGSAALLADALHNLVDGLTTFILLGAFWLAGRPASRRYSSGYGRIEDVATLLIVLVVAASAILAGFVAIEKFQTVPTYSHIPFAVGAAFLSMSVNWLVGEYKLKVGKEIGSMALRADGTHGRIDALAALAAGGGILLAAVGLKWADPVVGLGIAISMVYLLLGTIRSLYYRMMEAVDPEILARLTQTAQGVQGVLSVHDVRGRWVGRELAVTLHIDCDPTLNLLQAHEISRAVEEAVCCNVSEARLEIHIDPGDGGSAYYHGHHHLGQHGWRGMKEKQKPTDRSEGDEFLQGRRE